MVSCLKQKCLILSSFLSLYLVIFPILLNAQQINKLDNVINNGEISDFNAFKTDDDFQDTNTSTVFKKQTNAIVNSMIPIESNPLTLKEKQIIIKVNGKKRIITIPVFPPQKDKKQITSKIKRINESLVLVRINDNTSEINYDVPISYDSFGFPIDPKDKIRCEAEKKIGEIYNSISEMNGENYVDIVNSVHRTGYETIEKYSNYPDICATIQLYLIESFIKMYMINNNYGGLYSTSREYFKYMQLSSQYSHLNSLNQSMKTLHLVIEKRKIDLTNNEANLIKNNQFYFNQISRYNQSLIDYKNRLFNGIPSEKEKENYAKDIASIHAEICFCYAKIYENYMKMNNKVEADKFFKIENNGKGLKASGLLYEVYSSTPYDQIYKYQYQVSSNGETSTKTAEVKVLMYKDTDKFLRIIENMKYLQTIDKIDKITGDQSENEKRTLGMCQYLNDYVLDTGSEQKSAAEKINAEKLANYKKYAYAQLQMDSYIDYYKRKPVIKDLYVARTEDTKLSPSTVVRPDEFLVLCAKPDLSNYSKFASPGYSFSCKLYTTIPTQDEPQIPAFTKTNESHNLKTSINKQEIDRYKFVTLMPDVLNGGFYAKFQVNISTDYTNNDNIIDLSPGTADTYNLTSNNSKAQFKRSISVYQAEPENYNNKFQLKVPPTLYDIKKCKYFDKQHARAYIGYNSIDAPNKTLPLSKYMLLSGGAEIVHASIGIVSTTFAVCHTADWFIFEGHGNLSGYICDKNKTFVTYPDEIEKFGFYSTYKMKTLLLGACYCLNNEPNSDNYKKWQKVLPNGLILGYQRSIGFKSINYVLENMAEQLNADPNLPQQRIAGLWIKLNTDCYYNYHEDVIGISDKRPWSLAYIMPSPFTPNKSLYRYGSTYKNDFGETKIILNKLEF